jgi:hypothetical protein
MQGHGEHSTEDQVIMRLTKRIAAVGSLTLAAGALALGIAPAANAFTTSNCTWTSGNAFEICANFTSGPGGSVQGFATSWDGGQNFHVQLVSPSGATLCNSNTAANPAGVSVSCDWNYSGSLPAAGNYCAILWVVHDFEYQNWGEACIYG